MSRQKHRGPGPEDERLFAAHYLPMLREAAADLYWLLDRGYAIRSATELVGNRFALTERQRIAVARCACANEDVTRRQQRLIEPSALLEQELWIDGYNVLTILESALAGGIVLFCRDGCCRDIAGVHRRHRKVEETIPVLRLAGQWVEKQGVACCRWWLDKPVSNSGRLKAFILEVAASAGWNFAVELSFNPDKALSQSQHIVATSDGIILDGCRQWVNLPRYIIAESIRAARILDLSLPTFGPR